MDIRKMMLSDGWYPRSSSTAESMISSWDSSSAPSGTEAAGGVGPHAGWFFSGELSWNVVRNIPAKTDLIIIAGGHLLPGQNNRLLNFDKFETPFGLLSIDKDSREALSGGFIDDYDIDNTVEIYLPLLKFLFPDTSILPVRLSPSQKSEEWAGLCAEYSRVNRRRTFFLGSTDLSHYGSRFNYTDYGYGSSARKKIYTIDHDFLTRLCSFETEKAMEDIRNHQCACSGGAAIGSAVFSKKFGKTKSIILDHYYSYDIIDDDTSFVGYGGILYS